MSIFLLSSSILLGVAKTMICNVYAKKENPSLTGILGFNICSYGMAALFTLLMGIGNVVSNETLFFSSAYAIVVATLQILSIKAMTIGPMSLTSLFVLYGMVIPSLAGPILWQESITMYQVIGMIIMILSLCMLIKPDGSAIRLDKKWIGLALLCFILSGFAGLFEKIHQKTGARDERSMFVFLACIIMMTFSIITQIIEWKQNKGQIHVKTAIYYGASTGIIIGLYSIVNLTLAGSLDSLIYYPISNGGILMFTVLVSILFFREKPSRRQYCGFITGLLSIILLGSSA